MTILRPLDPRDFPNLTAAMEKAAWPEPKIRKIMGENWLRLLAVAVAHDLARVIDDFESDIASVVERQQ